MLEALLVVGLEEQEVCYLWADLDYYYFRCHRLARSAVFQPATLLEPVVGLACRRLES